MGLSRELPYLLLTGLLCLVAYDYEDFYELFKYDSSPIDWCEENYVYSPYIAEFFNTVSSFAMIMCALYGRFIYDRGEFRSFEPVSWVIWVLMAFVGVGSVLFHGTLSVAGQILDELPIVLTTTTCLLLLIPKRKWRPSYRASLFNQRPIVILVFFLSLALCCLRFPIFSHVITISCIPVVLVTFFKELWDFRSRSRGSASEKTKKAWANTCKLFALAFGCFFIAWTSWLIDRLYCKQVTAFFMRTIGFNLELHAWWHVFSSITFWFLVAAGIVVRTSGDGVDTALVYDGALPVISFV